MASFVLRRMPKPGIIFILEKGQTKGGERIMTHIKTIAKSCLKESIAGRGCGECQASCQSACKTSCTVANQKCLKAAAK
jgi:predicted ribosomally synthesized six-cysteine peptide SCIFF